ncbi:MAG: hypothetical protein HQK84_00025 [Nitrospinae bacterium]|nr:hypothetical protein [Nitrospinota bacterium]
MVINEVPYGVNKAKLAESIGKLVNMKKLPQISDLRDESTEVIRLVIEIKSDADPDKIMAYISRNTEFEKTFPLNFTCITEENRPEKLSIKGIYLAFIRFRKEVVINRINFELGNLKRRIHILEGFLAIFDDLDKAIKLIRSSKKKKEANEKLQKAFSIDEEQANAILDMHLYSLVGLEIDNLRLEHKEKQERVDYLEGLLADEKKIYGIMVEESEEIIKEFGDKRRTVFEEAETVEVSDHDFIVHEEVTLTLSKKGWVKYIKGRVEPENLKFRPDDELGFFLYIDTSELVSFITDAGKLYSTKIVDFPSGAGFGSPIQSIFRFADGENVISMIHADAKNCLTTIKRDIANYISHYGKKTELLKGDLIYVRNENEEGNEGEGIEGSLFKEETKEQPLQSTLYQIPFENDEFIQEKVNTLIEEKTIQPMILAVHENGKGFCFNYSQLGETTKTGRKFFNLKDGEKLASVIILYHPYVLLATADGKMVRIKSNEISVMNGPASGVILMRTEGEKVVQAKGVPFLGDITVFFSNNKNKEIKIPQIPLRRRGAKGKKCFLVKKDVDFLIN